MMRIRIGLAVFFMLVVGGAPAGAVNVDLLRQQINKGNYLMRTNHFQEAINQYEEALKTDPGNPIAKSNIAEAHNNWGIYYFGQHKYREAYAEWQKCLELAPSHANAKRNITILKRTAQQQGIDLSPPEPASGTADGAPPLDSGAAIGGAAVAQPGTAGAAPGGGKVQQAVEAPDPHASGAVVILSPLGKQPDQQPQTSAEQAVVPVAPTAPVQQTAPAAPPSIFGTTAPPSSAPMQHHARVNPLFPVLPSQFTEDQQPAPAAQPAGTASGAQLAPPAGPQPSVQPVAPPAPNAVPGGNSLEDQLGAIEVKVYGQKQADLTVLQRLEKIEKDTTGSARAGTIIERVEYLKKSYGI